MGSARVAGGGGVSGERGEGLRVEGSAAGRSATSVRSCCGGWCVGLGRHLFRAVPAASGPYPRSPGSAAVGLGLLSLWVSLQNCQSFTFDAAQQEDRKVGAQRRVEGQGRVAQVGEPGGTALLPAHRDWRSCWSRSWSRACHLPAASSGCRASASCLGTAAAWTHSPAAGACRHLPAMLASPPPRARSPNPWTWMLCLSPLSACATLC